MHLHQLSIRFVLYILSCIVIDVLANEDNGYILSLEHAFGEGEFAERAELYFPSIRGEKASVTKQAPITRKQYLLFDELAKNNGIYRIRVQSKLNPATSTTDSNDAVWLYSYTYAKFLKDANFCDDIVIHTDGLGNLMAINISPSVNGFNLDLDFTEFTTNVTVVMPGLAPVPDTAGYLNKLEEERIRKEKAANEPQTFFGKYWMYIVPMVIFMMLQSAAQQPQQG